GRIFALSSVFLDLDRIFAVEPLEFLSPPKNIRYVTERAKLYPSSYLGIPPLMTTSNSMAADDVAIALPDRAAQLSAATRPLARSAFHLALGQAATMILGIFL